MAVKKVVPAAAAAAKQNAAPKAAARKTISGSTAGAAAPKSAAKIAVGRKVPAFAGAASGGRTWQSAEAAGKNLVIYFYPRDNTPGCTTEGEAFRDLYPAFKKANTVILGVSTDSVASHDKFKAKFEFPFELLSDADQALCALFDVIKAKSMYGRKFIGVERSTFLIDSTGVLRNEWRKVKVPGHAEAVLAAAKAL